MASIKCLLALAALAVVANVRVEAGLARECDDIDYLTRNYDTAKAYSYGIYRLSTGINPLKMPDRLRLIRAWGDAIYDAKCSSHTFGDLKLLARCNPGYKLGLRTLRLGFENQKKKCLTPDYLEKKILSKSAGLVSNTIFGDVTKFIDSQFLDDYRKSNTQEPPIHLGTQTGDNCCLPEDGISAMANAIKRKYPDSLKDYSTEEKLSEYLKRDLFKPCKAFKDALSDFLNDLSMIVHCRESAELIAQLSPKAQDIVFTYNLCKNMRSEENQKEIVKRVFATIFKKNEA